MSRGVTDVVSITTRPPVRSPAIRLAAVAPRAGALTDTRSLFSSAELKAASTIAGREREHRDRQRAGALVAPRPAPRWHGSCRRRRRRRRRSRPPRRAGTGPAGSFARASPRTASRIPPVGTNGAPWATASRISRSASAALMPRPSSSAGSRPSRCAGPSAARSRSPRGVGAAAQYRGPAPALGLRRGDGLGRVRGLNRGDRLVSGAATARGAVDAGSGAATARRRLRAGATGLSTSICKPRAAASATNAVRSRAQAPAGPPRRRAARVARWGLGLGARAHAHPRVPRPRASASSSSSWAFSACASGARTTAPGRPPTRPRTRRPAPRRARRVAVVRVLLARRPRRRRRRRAGPPASASTSTKRWAKKPPTPPTRPSRWRRMTASAPSSARICGSSSSSLAAAVRAHALGLALVAVRGVGGGRCICMLMR